MEEYGILEWGRLPGLGAWAGRLSIELARTSIPATRLPVQVDGWTDRRQRLRSTSTALVHSRPKDRKEAHNASPLHWGWRQPCCCGLKRRPWKEPSLVHEHQAKTADRSSDQRTADSDACRTSRPGWEGAAVAAADENVWTIWWVSGQDEAGDSCGNFASRRPAYCLRIM